jgi:membrane-associated phospholipid phosphatase
MLNKFIHAPFSVLFFIFAALLSFFLFFTTKGDVVLWINLHHEPTLDLFFKYWTWLGDGIILALLLVFFIFYNYYYAAVTVVSIIFQSIVISVLKRWLFAGLERPLAFFGDGVDLNLVEGVNVHVVNTFPSGHTATAFSVFALLALAFAMRRFWLSALLFIMALLVGVSRIYLVQHFFTDVYAGAWTGLLSVVTGIVVTEYWFIKENPERYNKSLLKRS